MLLRYRQEPRRSVLQFAGYGLIALAVVAPWYVKSTIYTGNPFWPFLYNLFGGRNWDAVGDALHTSFLHRSNLPLSLWNYVAGLWYLTVRWQQFGGLRMGAAILAFVPLSLLFWRQKRWLLGYLVAASIIVYTVWFLTTQQTRFLIDIVPVLALLAAWAFTQLLQVWPAWFAALGRVAMVICFVIGLPFLNAYERGLIADRWPYVAGHVSRQEFLASHVDAYPAFQFANEHLPPDAKVLLATWETRDYYLDRASIWANPISQRLIKWEQLADAQAAVEFLHSLGITHVFWNNKLVIENVANEAHIDWLLRTMLAKYGRPIYDLNGFTIYELSPTP
jgi:hypothetical protein